MLGKKKIMYLDLDKWTLSQALLMGFDRKFKINLYMSIFLRLGKDVPVFQCLLSFLVIAMYVSMERLYAAKFVPVFYEA